MITKAVGVGGNMSSDGLIRFEESNWEDLVEKFIEKYRVDWEQFIMDEYSNQPEPPDRREDR